MPYRIVQTGRTKLGIIALTGPTLGPGVKKEGLSILGPVSRLQELIPEVADKARIIVLLSNQGYARDRELASRVKGIDIVIGSGSGKPLYQPARIGQTYFLRSHSKGKSIGAAELTIDENGRLESLKNRLVLLREKLPEDEKAAERVAKVAGTRKAAGDAAGRQPAAENPFLKILQERMQKQPATEKTETRVQPQKTPRSGESPPNPLLELLQRLQQQKKKSNQEDAAEQQKAQ
jgi:2',3'-cyclic-nucleotide 2'-phosphodiesterase (5'-nucleotidase family)